MLIVSLLSVLLSVCSPGPGQENLSIVLSNGYPRWLKADSSYTSQTSGITFIKTDAEGKHFLLADDIGALHHLTVKNDTMFTLKKIELGNKVVEAIADFPKKDFEEITYDVYTGKVLLSIEGNEPRVKSIAGIYELHFNNNDIFSDSVISISKLNIQPKDKLLQYTKDNVGFEGVAADEKYYYIALEGFETFGLFADSTFIYIVDKKDLTIKKTVDTKKLGIGTICGLYSDKNFSIYGVDRNGKKLFHLSFDNDLEVSLVSIAKIPTFIPSYKNFDYVVSFESVTMDDEKNLYLVDDPWRKHYIPSKEILKQLDENTVRNFQLYIPAVYKFNLKH